MKKIYVKEIEKKTPDGDTLITLKTYTSKPRLFNYIVFLDK